MTATAEATDHRLAAELELLAGLLHRVARTEWDLDDWRRALRPLRPKQARVVILHHLHGKTFTEIGLHMGLSRNPNSARGLADQQYRRALVTLSYHLKGELE